MKNTCESQEFCENYTNGAPADSDTHILIWHGGHWYCLDCVDHICAECGATMTDTCEGCGEV